MCRKSLFGSESSRTAILTVVSAVSLVLSFGTWLSDILPVDPAWIAILFSGIPIVYGATKALIQDHDIKADMLVSLALIASICIKEYFAAGEVAVIMQIGTLLEDFTSGQARKGIEKLVKLTPQQARIKKDGKEIIIPAEQVAAGDVIIVLAGEIIPADGTITSGETSVDQSAMTGESIPVEKKTGDSIMSGTVNQFGTFEMTADKACTDSSFQRIIRLAQDADANRAPIVSTADKWATWMVIVAVCISILTFIFTRQIVRSVTVLVVFCPCAFVLATPTAVAAGIADAARYGILIRSGDALERLSRIRYAAFDKTGTLTKGMPEVTDIITLSPSYTAEQLVALTAAAEQKSEHPLGKAVAAYCRTNGIAVPDAQDFRMEAGLGIHAAVNGHSICAGKRNMVIKDSRPVSNDVNQIISRLAEKDGTTIYISADGELAGVIILSDTLRNDSAKTITRLKSARITPVLLTGDNEKTARTIAAQAGIDEIKANLLPEGKMEIIREYTDTGKPVCMIGDGVNDALALGSACAGIAMGGIGSDIAVETADAVLVQDDIKRLPYLFMLTQKTMGRVKQNILISLVINCAAVTLSVLGLLTPVTGALVHNCGSVAVVINASLLLCMKDKTAE